MDSTGHNLSQAIRQLIHQYRQKTEINTISGDKQRIYLLRNRIIENKIAALIPIPLLKWLVERSMGVPPLGTFRVLMEKYTRILGITHLGLSDYLHMVNTQGEIFGYQVNQQIEVDSDSKHIRIWYETEDPDHLKGTVSYYSCMLAHHPLNLKTKKVVESPGLIIIDYEQCSNELEAYRSVMDHFGDNQIILDEIQKDLSFWRNVVKILKADSYESIIVGRDILLRLLDGSDFFDQLNHLISIVYGVTIEDTDYQDILRFIKEICKAEGLMQNMEYSENEIRIYHKFNDKKIILHINETILKILEMSGQHFVLKKKDKMTILSRK